MPRTILLLPLLLGLQAAAQAPGSGEVFDSAGVPIHYVESGYGEPVVLLHGFAADGGLWTMMGVAPKLAEDYRVITVDVRGHGKSGKPHEVEKYGTELVQDVVRLLDHLEIDRAHVVGYSMGAMITLKLAVTHPERVASAVAGGFGWARWDPPGEDLMDVLADSLEAGEGFGPLLEQLTPEGEQVDHAGLERANKMLLATNDPLALAAAARGFRQLELQEKELRANKVPLLSVIGELDSLEQDVERMVGVAAEHTVVVIEGGDHMTAGLSPKFLSSMQAFLEAHSIDSQLEPAGR